MVVEVRERLRLFHSADDVFELVSDVRRYPHFIPQITAMRVLDERRDGPRLELTAEARVRYKFVSERFTSRVEADGAARRIDVSFVAGPFRVLENRWHFHALSDGSCLVDFSIRAAFKNPILQVLLESNQERAGRVLISKFSAEAERRHERAGDPALDLAEEINAIG
ncbi:type II toxin-antitoxin system RatA family toxin [Maricaulis maris]|uniref:Coenzyme Q-binding protein COQ10 n=1 Tax=Maricaulis maris TaxID=74318 RepID=A0A495DJJ3_9PROT|nr:type II toxin-antitoxin system RatA family toxin [Maricaulis maris]RKR02794.1 coenzyme Q-binding protein COQ10 [Maricaulis maris]